MSDLYLIVKNLTRKKLRFVLTCFCIFIAFLIFGTVTALKNALDSGVDYSADNRLVVVHKTNITLPLPYAYVNKIKGIEGVRNVTHSNWFGGYYREPTNQIVTFAVEPESFFTVFDDLLIDETSKKKWLDNRTGVLVGERIARVNNWKVGDKIPLSSSIFSKKTGGQTWELTVDGIFEGAEKQVDTGYVVFHYKYFNETQSWGGSTVGWITLTTDDSAMNEVIAKKIDDTFANSQAETDTSTEKAFAKAFVEQAGNIGLIIFGVILMAFFTILVLVGNTMVLAIRERTAEIAVLKALGFTSLRVFKMVLMESLFLSFAGGLLGLLASYMVVTVMTEEMAQYLPNIVLSVDVVIQALLYMAILGLITGIIPAYNALKLNIITAFSRG